MYIVMYVMNTLVTEDGPCRSTNALIVQLSPFYLFMHPCILRFSHTPYTKKDWAIHLTQGYILH